MRYESVAGVRNLYIDHGRDGSPFVLRWKQDGKTKEKVLGKLGQKAAIRERDTFFGADVEDRQTASSIKVSQAFETWITAGRKSRGNGKLGTGTLKRYRGIWTNWAEPVLGRMRLADVTVKHIIAVIDRVEAEGKDPYNVYVLLSSFFHAMTKEPYSYRASNPVAKLGMRKPPAPDSEAISAEAVIDRREIEAITEAIPSRTRLDRGTRVALFLFAWHTGMRLSECLGLTWDRIDFQTGEIHVERQLTVDFKAGDPTTWFGPLKGEKTKVGQKARIVPLDDETEALLREHRQWALSVGLHRPEGLVFPTKKHTPIGQNDISELFTDTVGLTWTESRYPFTFHCLRHSFASRLFAAGAEVEEVARLVGHTSDTTIKRYIHLRDRAAYNEAYRERMRRAASLS